MLSSLRRAILAVLCMSTCAAGNAQRYLGIATSNFCAINSLYLNPASIADCNEKMSVGLFSLNAGLDNNLGHIPKIPDIGNAISDNNNIFTKSQSKTFSALAPAAVFRGPGLMATISRKISVALTTDIRAINQLNNFDPALYKAISSVGSPGITNYSAKAQNFNWTAHMWSEVGLTIGAVVRENDRYRLNLGATVRRLGGIGYVSVTGKNLNLNFRDSSEAFSALNSDIQFGSNVVNDSSTVFKNITPGGLFNKFFGETAGSGVGGDVGFTLRYRFGPIESVRSGGNDTHDVVFSASVTDIGAINYFKSTNVMLHITGGSSELTGKGLDSSVKDVASVLAYADQHGFKAEQVERTRRVYLPTALVTSVDVQVQGRFYANLLYIANLANRMNFGNSYYNQLTLTPRYDLKRMTLSLPLTYSMLAHDVKVGVGIRYAGVYVGSDDVLAAFSKCQYGFGLYLGGYIPIFKKKHDPADVSWDGY